MANNLYYSLLPCLLVALAPLAMHGTEPADSLLPSPQAGFPLSQHTELRLHATALANASSGDFAPYYIMSGHADLVTSGQGIQVLPGVSKPLGTDRFSWAAGASFLGGYTSSVDYAHYESDKQLWAETGRHPARLRVQSMWAAAKWRSVYLMAGMYPHHKPVVGSPIGSGDIVMSRNARPIPQVRAGFLDFKDIPFTNGWVQIFGDLGYGKMMDSDFLKERFNYYNYFLTTGVYMQYSRAYFRVAPRQNLSGTIGMQHATQFGGTWQQYSRGVEVNSEKNPVKIKDFFNAFFPWTGGSSSVKGEDAYFHGNHLGSWDVALDYRIPSTPYSVGLYVQSPWEDGSGIGKLNGFDGVWGLKYEDASAFPILKSAVVEYIDFTNQSGPIHWAPGDYPDADIPGQATGADDYYNNYMYNGWAYYGMAIGSPFIKSPIYNTDGYLRFTDNRVRGFHAAASGFITPTLEWGAAISYRTSWGTPMLPAIEKRHDTSMQAYCLWQITGAPAWHLGGTLAWDAGSLYGDNFGALVSLTYTLSLPKK